MRFLRLVVPIADKTVGGMLLFIGRFRAVLFKTLAEPLRQHRLAVPDGVCKHFFAVLCHGIRIEVIVLERALFRLRVHRQNLPQRIARHDEYGDIAVAHTAAHGIAVRRHDRIVVHHRREVHRGAVRPAAVQILHDRHSNAAWRLILVFLPFVAVPLPRLPPLRDDCRHRGIVVLIERDEEICLVVELLREVLLSAEVRQGMIVDVRGEGGGIAIVVILRECLAIPAKETAHQNPVQLIADKGTQIRL